MTICFEYHPSQRPLINVVVDQHSLAFCFPLIASSVSCNWFIYHCSRPVSTDTRHWFNQSNDLTLEDVHKLVKSVNSSFFFERYRFFREPHAYSSRGSPSAHLGSAFLIQFLLLFHILWLEERISQ